MISSAAFAPGCDVVVAGVNFFVASNDGKMIEYIKTSDPGFVTPEGLSVGSSVDDVRRAGGGEVLGEYGWAFYSRLPSGWRAVFSGMPDHEEPRTSGLLLNVPGTTVIAFDRTSP